MNGFLIVDKPAGVTSFDVVRRVRRWCQTRKVGHAGTLDPLATGVLPVAVGKATRLIEYVMSDNKAYRATLQLGLSTDTQDAEGVVIEEKDWRGVTEASLKQVVKEFSGTMEQLPPMFSALKKDGQPLYKLARQGIEVDRKSRTISIEKLTIEEIRLPLVTFTVQCSKGTYVRTICHDIGQRLGCGAHMTALRRTACSCFDIEDSIGLDELEKLSELGQNIPLLKPSEALVGWTELQVTGDLLRRLQDGVAPSISDLDSTDMAAGERIKFMVDDELVAIANFTPGGHKNRPGDFEVLKVFPLHDEQ